MKKNNVNEEELELIGEQEKILTEILRAIKEEQESRKMRQEGIRKRFLELRDETVGIRSQTGSEDTDLPMLYEQMHYQLSLAARKVDPLPSSHSPYFAHISLQENGRIRHILLGYTSFISSKSNYSIVDWRNAPISRLFFEYRTGEEYELELPGRVAHGLIVERHIVTIQRGELKMLKSDDNSYRKFSQSWIRDQGTQMPQLGGGQGTATRYLGESGQQAAPELAALLDRDQYSLLTQDPFKPLLILGGAGAGKTTVALHRLAHLNYGNPDYFKENNMLMIVPEPGLVRLCQNLLVSLGLGKVSVQTFDNWISKQKKKFLKGLPQRICEETPSEVVRFKRSHCIIYAIEAFIEKKQKESPGWILKQNHLKDHHDFFTDYSVLIAALNEEDKSLNEDVVKRVIRHTKEQRAEESGDRYKGYDPDRLVSLDGKDLDWATPDEIRGSIDIEDFAIMLEVAHRKYQISKGLRLKLTQYAHLVIDEAQELAGIELKAIGKAIPEKQSLTVAGDAMQQTSISTSFIDWSESLKNIGVKNSLKAQLKTNYRSPAPIANLAQQVLKPLKVTLPKSTRMGAPVKFNRYQDYGLACIQLIDTLTELMLNESRASVAIIVRNDIYAGKLYETIEAKLDCRLVLDGDFNFRPGIDVTSVASVKGLEFDYVVIPDANTSTYGEDALSRKTFYVALSRAMHQLWMISIGTPSLLLPSKLWADN
ncbi:MAG: 3'-5' exonuclease [Oligoflexales bacterium]